MTGKSKKELKNKKNTKTMKQKKNKFKRQKKQRKPDKSLNIDEKSTEQEEEKLKDKTNEFPDRDHSYD